MSLDALWGNRISIRTRLQDFVSELARVEAIEVELSLPGENVMLPLLVTAESILEEFDAYTSPELTPTMGKPFQ